MYSRLERFCMGKFHTQKIDKSCSLKSCGYSLETTFVLRLFKILGADGRTSASKIKKWQKTQNFNVFFKILREVYVQNPKIIACWMRLVIFLQEKNNFGHTLVRI
jgi:hypothetical protein